MIYIVRSRAGTLPGLDGVGVGKGRGGDAGRGVTRGGHGACITPDCKQPDYLVQSNGRCAKCNAERAGQYSGSASPKTGGSEEYDGGGGRRGRGHRGVAESWDEPWSATAGSPGLQPHQSPHARTRNRPGSGNRGSRGSSRDGSSRGGSRDGSDGSAGGGKCNDDNENELDEGGLEGLEDDIGAFALESRPVRIQKGMQWDRLDRDEIDDTDGGDGDGDDGDGGMGGDDDEDPSFADARLWRSFGRGVPRTARVLQCFHLPQPSQATGRTGEGREGASRGVATSGHTLESSHHGSGRGAREEAGLNDLNNSGHGMHSLTTFRVDAGERFNDASARPTSHHARAKAVAAAGVEEEAGEGDEAEEGIGEKGGIRRALSSSTCDRSQSATSSSTPHHNARSHRQHVLHNGQLSDPPSPSEGGGCWSKLPTAAMAGVVCLMVTNATAHSRLQSSASTNVAALAEVAMRPIAVNTLLAGQTGTVWVPGPGSSNMTRAEQLRMAASAGHVATAEKALGMYDTSGSGRVGGTKHGKHSRGGTTHGGNAQGGSTQGSGILHRDAGTTPRNDVAGTPSIDVEQSIDRLKASRMVEQRIQKDIADNASQLLEPFGAAGESAGEAAAYDVGDDVGGSIGTRSITGSIGTIGRTTLVSAESKDEPLNGTLDEAEEARGVRFAAEGKVGEGEKEDRGDARHWGEEKGGKEAKEEKEEKGEGTLGGRFTSPPIHTAKSMGGTIHTEKSLDEEHLLAALDAAADEDERKRQERCSLLASIDDSGVFVLEGRETAGAGGKTEEELFEERMERGLGVSPSHTPSDGPSDEEGRHEEGGKQGMDEEEGEGGGSGMGTKDNMPPPGNGDIDDTTMIAGKDRISKGETAKGTHATGATANMEAGTTGKIEAAEAAEPSPAMSLPPASPLVSATAGSTLITPTVPSILVSTKVKTKGENVHPDGYVGSEWEEVLYAEMIERQRQ